MKLRRLPGLRRLGRWLHLALAAVLMLAVWALLVWVASRPALKRLIDLTPQQVNRFDPATLKLIEDLREKKTELAFHTFWFEPDGTPQTDEQAQYLAITRRLRDLTGELLLRYSYEGGERVAVHHHQQYGDVVKTREAVQRFGVPGGDDSIVVTVQQAGRELRYRRLSLKGDLAVIELPGMRPGSTPVPRAAVPVLKDFKGEEALSSAIQSLLVQGTPVVYHIANVSPDLDTQNQQVGLAYGILFAALKQQGFDVQPLSLTQGRGVPRDASIVLVLEPRVEFTAAEARALFDFVKGGGRLLLDYSYSFGVEDWNRTGGADGELGKLLGFEVGPRAVFHRVLRGDDPNAPGFDGTDQVIRVPLGLNPNHPITRRLAASGRGFELASARAVSERAGAPTGMRREVLITSGPQAWLARPGSNGGGAAYDAPGIRLQSYPLGLAIEVDGPEKNNPGLVVVIGGVFANNAGINFFGELALNAFNWLAERRVLLDIAGSSYESKHFELTPDREANVQWLLILLVPGAFLLGGLLVFWLRRRGG